MKNTTAIGNQAEVLACEYLANAGYKIIAKNYRNRFCEIDVIAKNEEFIIFVEVKYRSSENYGGGLGAVNFQKQTRLRRSAEYWLAYNQWNEKLQPRIDVIAIDGTKQIEHLENVLFL